MTISILKTGHAEIDRQHAELLICLAGVKEFVGGQYAFSAGFTAIQALIGYTEDHFAFEEGLLRQWDYPDLDAHVEQHKSLVAEVRRQWGRVEQEGADIAREVVETIEGWITDHINVEDRKFSGVVRSA
uniref:Hemerythrin HHE cation binding region n=1 Tax=Dechloromonas aromatica (strain RCB) TaxID=159087 RepID=Q47FH3_DECAR